MRAPNAQGLSLSGVVRAQDGRPLAGATVLLAAAEQPSLATVACHHCAAPVLACRASETALVVSEWLDGHLGHQAAAASTTSDEQGRFRFEQLLGLSFTVWGRASGYGVGVKDRAAPGDPVELFLPIERAVVGRLTDESGAPLVGVVRAVSRRLAEPVEVATDAEGRFRFTGLGEGPFYVVGRSYGWLPAALTDVQAGPEPVVLALVSPRTLEVRLVGNDQRPLPGRVRLGGDHLSRDVDAKDGLAVVTGLPPGVLLLSATSGVQAAAPQPVTLASPVTRVTLVLEEGGHLAVTVLDEQGQPVREPTVEVLTAGNERVVRHRLATGALALLGPLGTGDYLVRASAEGFMPAQVPARVSVGETPLEVTLSPGALLAGRVIDEYGRAAPGVSVLVSPLNESVTSGPDGRFSSTVPSPGLYTLAAHHSDWGGGEVKVTAPRGDVELQLEPRAGCEITVLAGGLRVEGASVVMFTPDGSFRSDRVSGADGVVPMRGMPPNTYTLIATHAAYLPSERQTVKVDEGPTVRVTAELQAGANVTGQVVDLTGAPVANVPVSVMPRGAEPAVTDASGAFSIGPLRAKGTYVVKATQRGLDQRERVTATAGGPSVKLVVSRQPTFRGRVLGDGRPLKRFRVDGHEVSSSDGTFELPLPVSDDRVVVNLEAPGFEPMVADRPSTPDLGTFELSRAPLVTGVVRDEGGGGVADAVVSCESCEQSVMSGPDGRFSLSRPPYQREFLLVAKKGRRTATRAVVGEAAQGLELTLRPAVRLTGTAWLVEGRPAAGVELSGLNVDRGEPVSVVTNADGTYALDVAPGAYRFSLTGPGLPRISADPVASIVELSGPTARLDFGPTPGTGQVAVAVSPQPGHALWLVRGEIARVGNPPLELLRATWAQLIYMPVVERVTFSGVPPGRYTLVWGPFHAESAAGSVVRAITVPGTAEVDLR
ncbi:MAG: carboxypeptidase regulatory-like domain-containing protein [Myxococcaceae bacterium]|nr:carboxypeptidase regulatory-like domain-containing protein [Myxococcaceae bacterium]